MLVELFKGDVTRDDSQRRFLAQHSVATLFRIVTTLFQRGNAVLICYVMLRALKTHLTTMVLCFWPVWRQRGRVVRAQNLQFGGPEFKSRSDPGCKESSF